LGNDRYRGSTVHGYRELCVAGSVTPPPSNEPAPFLLKRRWLFCGKETACLQSSIYPEGYNTAKLVHTTPGRNSNLKAAALF
jgi:hypothetical protein